MDHIFSAYTVYVCAAVVAAWAALTVTIPSKRQKFVTSVKRTCEGHLEEVSQGEVEELPDLNLDSENFIAPGNIYRVLAACPPGSPGVSFSRWLGWSSKAFICAYMQIYLPCGFLNDIFSEWKLDSIKSPIWFLTNAGSFFTMFASLAAICSLFASKCSDNIRRGAKANFYILTHEAPAAVAPVSSPEDGGLLGGLLGGAAAAATADVASVQTELATSLLTKPPMPTSTAMPDIASAQSKLSASLLIKPPALPDVASASKLAASLPMPTWPPLVITINEYFWCTFSMIMNISMSMLLQLVMFLKVATFTGTMESVAVVTLSLYFVIELDKKVMESDPKLRPMYRTQVKAQTVEKTYKPMWLKKIASFSMGLMNETVPLGLLGVVLFSWKNLNTGMIIGGDPFAH